MGGLALAGLPMSLSTREPKTSAWKQPQLELCHRSCMFSGHSLCIGTFTLSQYLYIPETKNHFPGL